MQIKFFKLDFEGVREICETGFKFITFLFLHVEYVNTNFEINVYTPGCNFSKVQKFSPACHRKCNF